MILGLLAGVLNRFIGAYFEDIDASQLTGSIFGGGVTLNDVNLRPTIFESLGIPFHVVGGKCGKLEIKYSLTRLYSEPIIVSLKDLHVLIVSARGVEYDEQAEQDAIQNEKLRQLEIFESVKHQILLATLRMAQRNAKKKKKAPDESKVSVNSSIFNATQNILRQATYFDTWVMQIVKNIQFQIERVHIRFEDDETKPEEPFAAGIFLENLEVYATDSYWNIQYIKDYIPETTYKLVKVSGLSMYWNPWPNALYKELDDKQELFQKLATTPSSEDAKAFCMIFEPLSIDLKVHITPFPDFIMEPFSKPRLLIETNLDEFKVNISDKQFRDIIPFLDTLDFIMRGHKYRKFRVGLHKQPYQGHYKEWWQFAYHCILDDIQRRRNNFRWSHISEYRKKCKAYLKAYYKKTMENLGQDPEICKLEQELDLLMLIILRQQADLIISRSKPQLQASEEGYIAWIFSLFTYSYWFPPPSAPGEIIEPEVVLAAEPNSEIQAKPPSSGANFSVEELTPHDKEVIRVAAGFTKKFDIVNCPDEYVALEVNVIMKQLRTRVYRLLGQNPETVLDGVLLKVSLAMAIRPIDDGLEVELKVGRVDVYGGDFVANQAKDDVNATLPLITTANRHVSEYFIKLVYEMNPLDSEVNHKVSLEGLALQFTYLADSIERIAECFAVPSKKEVPKKKGTIPASRVLHKIMQFKNSPTSKLLAMMDNKGKIGLNVSLIAPYLVIPQDSTAKGRANLVVVSLGEINLVGTLVGGTICENGICSHFL